MYVRSKEDLVVSQLVFIHEVSPKRASVAPVTPESVAEMEGRNGEKRVQCMEGPRWT